jgi:hypothetical protein
MSNEIPLDKSGFERALRDLRSAAERSDENPGSYQSDGCTRCFGCMFTTDSVDCFNCTYCANCEQCSDCTHCKQCENCHNCSYSVQSRNCSNSQYVILSENCANCTFCFGCVGLVNKEFHILNQKFPRKVYFEKLETLKKAFGIE